MVAAWCSTVAVVAITACGAGSSREKLPGGSSRPVITVSIAPQATLLRAIAGDSVVINTLLNTTLNPETYEPGLTTMKTAAGSDALFLVGTLDFERQLVDRITDNNPHIKVVNTSQGVTPIYGTHQHATGHVDDDEHGVADPHTWTSVVNMRAMAGTMLAALIEIDAANSQYYTDRAARLDAHLDSLNQSLKAKVADMDNRNFLSWHPSLSYLARDYGLNQISIGNEGRESSGAQRLEVINRAADSGARVLFISEDYDIKNVMSIADQTGVEVATFNPLDANWETQIINIVNTLANVR